MTDQQKMATYQMRLHQQLQGSMQMQAQMQAQNLSRGMMPNQQVPATSNGQVPPGIVRPQQKPMPNANVEHFMKNLVTFMHNKGLPLDLNPVVGDRPVHLMMLFQAVQSRGGSKNVSAANGWGQVAHVLGLPAHVPTVPPTLRQMYERNLQTFEEVWTASQKQRMNQQNMQATHQGSPQQQQTPQNHQMSMAQVLPGQQPHARASMPMKAGQTPANGMSVPQAQQQQQPQVPGHNRQPSTANDLDMSSPVSTMAGSMPVGPGDGPGSLSIQATDGPLPTQSMNSDVYTPCSRELSTYGGIDVMPTSKMGAELERWRPDVPSIECLGNLDVAALTRSLQSGIHAEIRLALDTLAAMSNSLNYYDFLQLKYCDDLVDALIDCAEEQLDELAEATAEVSDEIQLTPFEDIARQCKLEQLAVQDVPPYGSTEYNLDRAVDKLICVTTILRNLSFPGEGNENHLFLVEESVIKFLCVMIRYLGTRTMLLRTSANTLDFMKDVVVLLSNISTMIEIPGREQAFCLLHFLLAFAPASTSTSPDEVIFFQSYDPNLHPYLPHAVDSLAKLLARDEPNRTLYKNIFSADSVFTNVHDILTRAFALAISPIPEKTREWSRSPGWPSIIEMRKPFLMQGLLAAEILASLAPGPESALARMWLQGSNGWAQYLFRLVRELSHLYEHPQVFMRTGVKASARKDPELLYLVVLSISLLRRLTEKARDTSDPKSVVPVFLMIPSQVLMDALTMQSAEWTKEGFLQQLTAVVSMSS